MRYPYSHGTKKIVWNNQLGSDMTLNIWNQATNIIIHSIVDSIIWFLFMCIYITYVFVLRIMPDLSSCNSHTCKKKFEDANGVITRHNSKKDR